MEGRCWWTCKSFHSWRENRKPSTQIVILLMYLLLYLVDSLEVDINDILSERTVVLSTYITVSTTFIIMICICKMVILILEKSDRKCWGWFAHQLEHVNIFSCLNALQECRMHTSLNQNEKHLNGSIHIISPPSIIFNAIPHDWGWIWLVVMMMSGTNETTVRKRKMDQFNPMSFHCVQYKNNITSSACRAINCSTCNVIRHWKGFNGKRMLFPYQLS